MFFGRKWTRTSSMSCSGDLWRYREGRRQLATPESLARRVTWLVGSYLWAKWMTSLCACRYFHLFSHIFHYKRQKKPFLSKSSLQNALAVRSQGVFQHLRCTWSSVSVPLSALRQAIRWAEGRDQHADLVTQLNKLRVYVSEPRKGSCREFEAECVWGLLGRARKPRNRARSYAF